jgi:hypothetical protein
LFSGQVESATIVELDQTLEATANDRLVHGELVLSIVRDLKDHRADEVATVEHLQVNLHVEGDLSLVLLLLVLTGLIELSAEPLGKELLVLGVVADVGKQVVSFLDLAKSESGKSSLSEGTVIKDLVIDLGEVSADVGLHHDVLGFT